MRHQATAAVLLFVGMVASYSFEWVAPELAADVWNIGSSALILFLLMIVAATYRSWEMVAVCATLAGFKVMVIGCTAWFMVDPWPTVPGQALCSQRLDMPLGVLGLIIAGLLVIELSGGQKK